MELMGSFVFVDLILSKSTGKNRKRLGTQLIKMDGKITIFLIFKIKKGSIEFLTKAEDW